MDYSQETSPSDSPSPPRLATNAGKNIFSLKTSELSELIQNEKTFVGKFL